MLIDSDGRKLFIQFSNLLDPAIRVARNAPERGRWDGARWTVEPTYAVVDYLRDKGRWSKRAKEVLVAADDLRRNTAAPAAPRDDFTFKRAPLVHQLEIFNRSRDRKYFALLMEQGTGKTKLGLDTAAWLFCRGEISAVLITAFPDGVHRNWIYDELPVNLPDFIPYRACAWNTAKAGTKTWQKNELELVMNPEAGTLDVLAVNVDGIHGAKCYDACARFIRNHAGRVLFIVDESTTIKTHTSKRTKLVQKLAAECAYRRIMTGTPSPKSPLDLYAQFETLKDGYFDGESFTSFRSRYAIMKPLPGKVSRFGRPIEIVDGYKDVEKLYQRIAPDMARVLKSECLDLPEKIYMPPVRYELQTQQAELYRSMADDLIAKLDDGTQMTSQMAMTKLMRLHQITMNIFTPDGEEEPLPIVDPTDGPHPRLKALLDLTETLEGKAIIWATYKFSLREILGSLLTTYGPGSAIAVWGEVDSEQRRAGIERWRTDERCRFIVAHPRALGYGYTLNEAESMIYYSNDYSLELRLQSEDRAHRIGQTKHLAIYDIMAENTVDEKIVAAHKAKKDLAAIVTGDNIRSLIK